MKCIECGDGYDSWDKEDVQYNLWETFFDLGIEGKDDYCLPCFAEIKYGVIFCDDRPLFGGLRSSTRKEDDFNPWFDNIIRLLEDT